MPYVKVDDGFPEHPKALGISRMGIGLWLESLCFCNRRRTDGLIPRIWPERVGAPAELVQELVTAGLWDVVDGGWRMHDYLDWQRSKAEIESLSEVRAEAGKKGGLAKAKQVATKRESTVKQTPGNLLSKTLAETEEETEEETETETDAAAAAITRDRATALPSAVNQPFALLEALCDEQGQDVSVLSKAGKSKQLAVAKRLVATGLCADDVRKITRWLRSQAWVTGGIDLFLLESQADKWRLAGQPETAAVSSNGHAPHRSGIDLQRVRQIAEGRG